MVQHIEKYGYCAKDAFAMLSIRARIHAMRSLVSATERPMSVGVDALNRFGRPNGTEATHLISFFGGKLSAKRLHFQFHLSHVSARPAPVKNTSAISGAKATTTVHPASDACSLANTAHGRSQSKLIAVTARVTLLWLRQRRASH